MGDRESLEAGGVLVEEELKWNWLRETHLKGSKYVVRCSAIRK